RSVRVLLILVFVPVVIVAAVLATAVLGHGASGGGAGGSSAVSVTAEAPETGPPSSGYALRDAERLDVGSGAQGATVFRPRNVPAGRGRVVIFLHGWVAIDPARYGPWIGHLVRRGATVIFPAYQTKPAYDTTAPLSNVLAGVRAALGQVQLAPGRLVIAGHSAGGALAADYAAVATGFGLPAPAAVFSVYPGRKLRHLKVPIPTADLTQIAPGTRVLALVGERDTAVGSGTAHRIVAGALLADTTLVTIRDDDADLHRAPRSSVRAAQRAFWAPLDALVEATQPANDSATGP
ncbi:MAG: alpha/beta hydrolase, partial [Actinomycetota bacterium]|nr:alpha/beta hydrolase [Actinomycetota bacterium]